MRSERKAFKVVYELIADGVITDKEAFNLIEGIFEKEYYPVPVPTQVDFEQDIKQEPVQQIEVAGFRLPQ